MPFAAVAREPPGLLRVRSSSWPRPLTAMAGHRARASGAALTVLVSGRAQDARLDESPGGITRKGCERVISGQRVAIGAEQAADCVGELCLPVGFQKRGIGG